jgi:hypothetical protein
MLLAVFVTKSAELHFILFEFSMYAFTVQVKIFLLQDDGTAMRKYFL